MPFDGSLSERLPTPDEAEKAKQATITFARLKNAQGALSLNLKDSNGDAVIELPPAVSQMILNLLLLISKGEAVTLVPFGAQLTTQQAADLLNVSRPFLVKELNSKKLPYHKVGTHRRINADDLLAYKKTRDANRRETLRELARLGQEIESE